MQVLKKGLMGLAMLLSSLGLQGCTDEQVGAAAGVAVGVIIGSELADDDHHHHGHYRRNPPHYRRGYDGYRGYRGYPRYSNPSYGCRHYVCPHSATGVAMDEVSPEAAKVSSKYEIPADSAEVLVSALYQAQQGDLSALAEVGLQKEDFVAIYNNKNPSSSAVSKMSQVLNLDVPTTQSLIKKIKAELEQARKAQAELEDIYRG